MTFPTTKSIIISAYLLCINDGILLKKKKNNKDEEKHQLSPLLYWILATKLLNTQLNRNVLLCGGVACALIRFRVQSQVVVHVL